MRKKGDEAYFSHLAAVSFALCAFANNEHLQAIHPPVNRPFLYSRYWTGTSMQLRLMRGVFSNANDINLFLMIFPHISLNCKLVPVQYREYEYGPASQLRTLITTY